MVFGPLPSQRMVPLSPKRPRIAYPNNRQRQNRRQIDEKPCFIPFLSIRPYAPPAQAPSCSWPLARTQLDSVSPKGMLKPNENATLDCSNLGGTAQSALSQSVFISVFPQKTIVPPMRFAKQMLGTMRLLPSHPCVSKLTANFLGCDASTPRDSLPKDGMPLGVVQAKMTGQHLWGTESPSPLIRSVALKDLPTKP
jgi:hypothetical protein